MDCYGLRLLRRAPAADLTFLCRSNPPPSAADRRRSVAPSQHNPHEVVWSELGSTGLVPCANSCASGHVSARIAQELSTEDFPAIPAAVRIAALLCTPVFHGCAEFESPILRQLSFPRPA